MSDADDDAAQTSARFGWSGRVEEGDDDERDEGEDERPAGQPVEPVGDVHAVAGGDDREGREQR